MPEIKLTNVTKRWGKFYAVENLNLDIEDNSFITLLGPSGCGKTTTLRMIAGLETPTSGRITIGDRVVFDSEQGINVPANKRKVGFLFQNYALWPNMTVYKNIAFGLSNIKEEMPVIDFEARKLDALIRVLKNAKEAVELINECRDKSGKVDEDRAKLLIIDTYTVSMTTAKSFFGYRLHEDKIFDGKARTLITQLSKKLDDIIAGYKAKKTPLNENFEVTVDGKVVTKVRKLSAEEVDLSVRRVSRIVKIGMFMDRYPAELSGGQQQRVAIARTLAPEPAVLFMDEPLSNLDAKLRLEMRYELQRLHVETGSTFVYVTHDQMEAMTLATKICLINNGVLQQYAAPLTVYNHPANLFVADFVGNPSINFIEATGTQNSDGSIRLECLGGTKCRFIPNEAFKLDEWIAERNAEEGRRKAEHAKKLQEKGYVEKGNKDEVFKYSIARVSDDFAADIERAITDSDFVLGIRPEFIAISDDGKAGGTIYGAMPTGMETTLKINVNDYLLTSVVFGGEVYRIGSTQNISFKGAEIMLFERKFGKCICNGRLECE